MWLIIIVSFMYQQLIQRNFLFYWLLCSFSFLVFEVKKICYGTFLSNYFSNCLNPFCGEPFQMWEMWLSPHSEKPVGSEVGGQDPRPWIASPVGNQACIVPRLPWDLLLLKTPSPWGKQMFTEYLYLPKIWARPSRYGTLPFGPLLPLHC